MRITKDMAIGSTQMLKVQIPSLHVCSHCDTKLGPIIAPSDFAFGRQSGKCDCSWACCEETKAQFHKPHIIVRSASEAELEVWPTTWDAFHEVARLRRLGYVHDDSYIGEELIRHIEKTTDPLAVTNIVIGALGANYNENRNLIQGLLYYKYDLQGM